MSAQQLRPDLWKESGKATKKSDGILIVSSEFDFNVNRAVSNSA